MVAADGKVVPLRRRIGAALDLSHAPPKDIGRISILLVARHHAAFAADALRHVEMKAVLLAGAGIRSGWAAEPAPQNEPVALSSAAGRSGKCATSSCCMRSSRGSSTVSSLDEETLSASARANTRAFQHSHVELRVAGSSGSRCEITQTNRPAAEPVWEAKQRKNAAPIGVTAFEHNGKLDDTQVETRWPRKDGIKVGRKFPAFQILMRSSRAVL